MSIDAQPSVFEWSMLVADPFPHESHDALSRFGTQESFYHWSVALVRQFGYREVIAEFRRDGVGAAIVVRRTNHPCVSSFTWDKSPCRRVRKGDPRVRAVSVFPRRLPAPDRAA